MGIGTSITINNEIDFLGTMSDIYAHTYESYKKFNDEPVIKEAEEKVAPKSIFSIRFYTDENEREHAKILETVKEDEEKAQSIAIRLKL